MVEAVQGAQVVSRVAAVVRAVAELAPGGGPTSQIAGTSGLTRSTVHRLLSSLRLEGYVERDDRSGLWFLGPELYVLGALAGARFDVTEHARAALRAVATETGESAFFSVRRQNETVCLMREEGSFPLRSFVLQEGTRFPLGVASAGMAILAHLSDSELESYLASAELGGQWGSSHERDTLWKRVAVTRRHGYAVNPGLIVEGSWGMGAAVFNVLDQPEWAISITGVESRFRPERQARLGNVLLTHAHQLSRALTRR
jgi:DNA-binding IclR family transcriptional regulator